MATALALHGKRVGQPIMPTVTSTGCQPQPSSGGGGPAAGLYAASVANRSPAIDDDRRRDLGELLREHDPMMRAVAFRIVGPIVLDDVMQEAYLRAVKSYSSFEGRSTFRTWLYRIVRNTAVDHIRRTQRRVKTVSDDLLPVEPAGPDGYGPLEIEAAIAGLPLEQREALTLVAVVGLNYGEAATLLELPEGTVASRVHRARAALRTVLEEVDQP